MSVITRVHSLLMPKLVSGPMIKTNFQLYHLQAETLRHLPQLFLNTEFDDFSLAKVLHPLEFGSYQVLALLERLKERCSDLVATVKGFNELLETVMSHEQLATRLQMAMDEAIEVNVSHRLYYIVEDIVNLLWEFNMQFDRRRSQRLCPITSTDLDAYHFVEMTLSGRGALAPTDLGFFALVVEKLLHHFP